MILLTLSTTTKLNVLCDLKYLIDQQCKSICLSQQWHFPLFLPNIVLNPVAIDSPTVITKINRTHLYIMTLFYFSNLGRFFILSRSIRS